MPDKFDAVLLMAFGGPGNREDIRPFLQNVVRGRPVPPERLEEVAHHYEVIGGKSPLNELTFRQARALEGALATCGLHLPVFVGMRNWHPFLSETLHEMAKKDIERAIGIIMAPQQSEASWEKYQRNVSDAVTETGLNIEVDYTEPFFNHRLFIEAAAAQVKECAKQLAPEEHRNTFYLFTAHSVPLSDPFHERYAEQIRSSSRLVMERLTTHQSPWSVAYQSRSGRPEDPWLEPDVNDALRALASEGTGNVVIVSIGFVCDHVEVLYDLDMEAAETARSLGIKMLRAKTVNHHPKFIECLADLVLKKDE